MAPKKPLREEEQRRNIVAMYALEAWAEILNGQLLAVNTKVNHLLRILRESGTKWHANERSQHPLVSELKNSTQELRWLVGSVKASLELLELLDHQLEALVENAAVDLELEKDPHSRRP